MTLLWRCIHTISGYHSFRFSPDGKTLFLGNQMLDVNTGESSETATESNNSISSLDRKTLVACDSDGQTLQLRDAETGELTKIFTPNSSRISLKVLSHDSQTLVTYDAEENLKLWNVSTGEPTHNLGQVSANFSAIFSPNGQILALSWRYLPPRFWDINTGQQIGNLDNNIVGSFVFTSDNKALLIEEITKLERTEVYSAGGSDWYENERHTTQIWDLLSGQKIKTLYNQFLSLSPDGQFAILKQRDYCARKVSKFIHFSNLNGGKAINSISGGTNAAFSPLGNIIAVVENDGQSLKLLSSPSGREITTIPGYISDFTFSPDEKTLVITGNDSIKVWHQSTKPIVRQSLHGNAYPHLTKLENLLAAELWEDADKETAAIIKSFPSQDLNPIDQLWVHYSKGHYGFSMQKKIWGPNNNFSKAYENFQLSVGWGTMETDHMYHGENDQYVATAWQKTYKGYYPRECYGTGFYPSSEIWSRLKG